MGEGVPSVKNESSDDVLGKVKFLVTESECEIPGVVIDTGHRIGKRYKDKSLIITTFTLHMLTIHRFLKDINSIKHMVDSFDFFLLFQLKNNLINSEIVSFGVLFFFYLSRFSFTNIHDPWDSRGRGRVSI